VIEKLRPYLPAGTGRQFRWKPTNAADRPEGLTLLRQMR